MPSTAFLNWQSDRMVRLGHMSAHCASLLPTPPLPVPAAHVDESLQGYVMLVSGHFQGFCRDLYTECAQLCAATVVGVGAMQTTIQAQFTAGLSINTGNPTIENIRKDFERFGFSLDLVAADAANARRITDLGHLNYWRNHVAHQRATPPPPGVPTVLGLANIQKWHNSCDGLATSVDDIMKLELTRILGVAPW